MVVLLDRNEERGEELKVPHHARATSTRDGNMPRVTATCLIPDSVFPISKGEINCYEQLHFLIDQAVESSSMAMVGSAYNLKGRWKEAEELEVQVMETIKRVLGEEHPDTLTSIKISHLRSRSKAATTRLFYYWKNASSCGKRSLALAIHTQHHCLQL